jgi:hypothetical protein
MDCHNSVFTANAVSLCGSLAGNSTDRVMGRRQQSNFEYPTTSARHLGTNKGPAQIIDIQ